MTHFVIDQLAPDHAAYGADAGRCIVTSEDLEREFSGPMGVDDAHLLASALNACQAVADRWERGDLAEAARAERRGGRGWDREGSVNAETPWGPSQSSEEIPPGIVRYDTTSPAATTSPPSGC